MSHLVPCLACHRHVRAVEEQCPFCGAARSAELRASAPPAEPKRRLGRAALFTFGATLVSAACGSDATTPADGGMAGQTADAASETGAAGSTGGAGSGGSTGSAGMTGSAGTTGGAGTGAAPAYGAPAPLYGLPAATDK